MIMPFITHKVICHSITLRPKIQENDPQSANVIFHRQVGGVRVGDYTFVVTEGDFAWGELVLGKEYYIKVSKEKE